jgi:uncharacterized membrane protein SpoIIM required for sporulation
VSAPLLKSYEFRRERQASWVELERLVAAAERSGLQRLSAAELARLPVLYRAALSSLSVARAISLDRNVVEYLEALCARAYVCVYGARDSLFSAVKSFLGRRFPRAVRRHWGVVTVALLLTLLAAAAGAALVVEDPDRFHAIVDAGLAGDRGPESTTEQLRAALYHGDSNAGGLAALTSFLFTHNAGVGILCFALGFAAGVPTALLLMMNGLMLGAFGALYGSRGLSFEFWAWVAPHGIPEILAVVLCGAGGLLVAKALMFPGRLSRLDNLAREGRDAGALVLGSIALLLLAGFLEGVVRQTVLDPIARISIAAVVGLGVFSWILFAGRKEDA